MAPALAFALPLLFLACGKRGDPLPPLRKTPQPVSGLRLAQRGDVLEIAYTAPRATTDGVTLPVLDVELLRADAAGDFGKVAQVQKRRVAPGEALVETVPLPAPGTTVRVAARAVSKGHPSPLTDVATLRVMAPPEPPSGLRAAPSAEGVRLLWRPPALMPTPAPPPTPPAQASPSPPSTNTAAAATGTPAVPSPTPAEPSAPTVAETTAPQPPSPAEQPPPSDAAVASPKPSPAPTPAPTPRPPTTGFFVYRRPPGGTFVRVPPPVPLQEPSASDPAGPGENWCYAVRTVAATDPLVESVPTPEACVAAVDVAPPAAPAGAAVLARAGALEFSWSPSAEADLAGYRVYRAPRGGRAELLAELPKSTTLHRDADVRQGVVHVYTVTAVDAAGNESPPSAGAQGSPE